MPGRTITAVLVDRANYGRLLPLLQAVRDHPLLTLHLVLGGSFVLERFGSPWTMLEDDGLAECVIAQKFFEVDGNRRQTMAISTGMATQMYADALSEWDTDAVLIIGDRYEALAAATAAYLCGVCLIHVQGGEITGHWDEKTRHAITQMADYHVPSTERARDILLHLGVTPEAILAIGCPSSDLARGIEREAGQYLVVVYHPDSEECDQTGTMRQIIDACNLLGKPTFVFWPNIDAGSNAISKVMRQRRDVFIPVKNIHPVEYLKLLASALCVIGNSSSFVREAGYWGVPALMLGGRQRHREHAGNVIEIDSAERLAETIRTYAGTTMAGESPYWRPGVSKTVVAAMTCVPFINHRVLSYADRGTEPKLHDAGSAGVA